MYEVQLFCDCYGELVDSPGWDSSLHLLDTVASIYCQPCEQTILNVQSRNLQMTKAPADIWLQWHEKPEELDSEAPLEFLTG